MEIRDRLTQGEGRGDGRATEPDHDLNWKAIGLVLNFHVGGFILSGLIAATRRRERMDFAEGQLIAYLVLLMAAAGFAAVWLGYRRPLDRPLWRRTAHYASWSTAGMMLSMLSSLFSGGAPISGVEDIAWYAVFGLITGAVASNFTVRFDRAREHEAKEREAGLKAEAERERLAKRMVEAELKLLQAQVEPHFLFNTLANLRWLVQTGSKDALRMLDHLIDYLRTALPEMRAEGSTVAREAALARDYLEILRIRMGGEMEFAVDIAPELEPHAFPPLMLMTLVENAVKHGIAPVGRGRIDVRVSRHEGRIRTEVEDDGRGLAEAPGEGVGLANVRERLAALYGDAGSLLLAARLSGGTIATLEIPEVKP